MSIKTKAVERAQAILRRQDKKALLAQTFECIKKLTEFGEILFEKDWGEHQQEAQNLSHDLKDLADFLQDQITALSKKV